jgi:hypothetical protein
MSDIEPDPADVPRQERIKETGTRASDAVQHAATVFEEELAAGIAGAEQLERRFRDEHRIDPRELHNVIGRFRSDGHEVIEVLADRIGELQPGDTRSLAQRFIDDAHGLLDTFANLVDTAPDIVNRLMEDQRAPGSSEKRGNDDR